MDSTRERRGKNQRTYHSSGSGEPGILPTTFLSRRPIRIADLYFVASEREGDDLATFTIAINGDKVLQNFDVVTDALGENVADERVFRDVAPAKDGIATSTPASVLRSERGVHLHA